MARLATIAFAMALALCVVAPAAAQSFLSLSLGGSSPFVRASSTQVSWTTSGSIPSVQLRVCSDNVACITQYGALMFPASNPYTWTIPNLASGTSTTYYLEIASVATPSIKRYSLPFSVQAISSSISIDTVGTMTRGVTKTISWTCLGAILSVNISLMDTGSVVAQLGSFVLITSIRTSFDYAVPATLASGSRYQVRITSAQYAPIHDSVSAITSYLTVEAASASIRVSSLSTMTLGSTKNITWTYTGTISTVNITLLSSGSVVQVIALDAPNIGWFDYVVPSTLPVSYTYQVRIVASKYSPAHDATVGTSSYFSTAEKQSGGGGSGSSSGGGGGGGGAAAAIIIIIVVLAGGGAFYKRYKEQAAQRDMEKMQGINQSGQAVAVPLPADQYVTEGIPLCYFSHAAMAPPSAPPQPDTLVVPVLVPVSPVAATSPSAHYSEHTGLIAPQ